MRYPTPEESAKGFVPIGLGCVDTIAPEKAGAILRELVEARRNAQQAELEAQAQALLGAGFRPDQLTRVVHDDGRQEIAVLPPPLTDPEKAREILLILDEAGLAPFPTWDELMAVFKEFPPC